MTLCFFQKNQQDIPQDPQPAFLEKLHLLGWLEEDEGISWVSHQPQALGKATGLEPTRPTCPGPTVPGFLNTKAELSQARGEHVFSCPQPRARRQLLRMVGRSQGHPRGLHHTSKEQALDADIRLE